jgi:hypothetical protein
VRRKRSTAVCPGIGWERLERRVPATIGGRSERWRSALATYGAGRDDADEDAVIIRGRE